MKKTNILLTTLAISALLLVSCASNKQINTIDGDSYNDVEQPKTEVTSTKTNQNNSSNRYAKKKPTFSESVKDFFTFGNKNDFIKNDTAAVYSTTVTGSIKQQNATIFISTKEDLAGFGSSYMAAYYIVLMDRNARTKLETAYNAYLSDFENKRLNRKNSKSFKQYGTFQTTLNWGALEATTPNHGSGTAYLGYEFKNNSPFFTISNYPYENKYYEVAGDSTSRESMSIKYYFTKSQLGDILEKISEKAIAEAFNENDYLVTEDVDDYISADSTDTDVIED